MLDLRVLLDCVVHLASRAHWAPRVLLDQADREDLPDLLVLLAPLDSLDHLGPVVILAALERLDFPDARVLPEAQAQVGVPEPQAPQAFQEQLASLDRRANKVSPDHQDLLDLRERLDSLEALDLSGLQVQLGFKVVLASVVHLAFKVQCSSLRDICRNGLPKCLSGQKNCFGAENHLHDQNIVLPCNR